MTYIEQRKRQAKTKKIYDIQRTERKTDRQKQRKIVTYKEQRKTEKKKDTTYKEQNERQSDKDKDSF